MPSLILKLGAAGDVVRTTPLLRVLDGEVHWLTLAENAPLLEGSGVRVFTSPHNLPQGTIYRRIISLEDNAAFLREVFARVGAQEVVGTYPAAHGGVAYGPELAEWFDMSLSSRFGRRTADRLKLGNRHSYQELLFAALGRRFAGEEYLLPGPLPETDLAGDIAFAPVVGERWPMKRWAFFELAATYLSSTYRVNILPRRHSMLEHVADIRAHRVVVTNDSLPMHLALACGKPCAAFFTCTSPWEIHDYGRLEKVVSPHLAEFFYRCDFDDAATTAIPFAVGLEAIERAVARAGIACDDLPEVLAS
jgi:heptosyltransferase II